MTGQARSDIAEDFRRHAQFAHETLRVEAMQFDKAKQVIAAGQLIQRNLQPTDLTGTIIYLASDSSAFVTGQTHMVDGGSWFL